jgi:hypothetical protein
MADLLQREAMDVEHVNALMFQAESQQDHPDYAGLSWHEFLGEVLAPEFKIRRSAADRPLEGRDDFLDATRNAQARTRTVVPGSVRIWKSASVAAIVCLIEMEGRNERFTNTRIFGAGGQYTWRCEWWQVTATEEDAYLSH